MSTLFRLSQTLRTQPNPLQSLRKFSMPKSRISNHVRPSHVCYTGHLGHARHRFYSNNSYRGYADQYSNNIKVLYSLIGINTAVFGYAMYTKAQAQQGYPGPFMKFFRNWTCNLHDVVKSGMWWQPVTSIFAHVDFMHFAGNMFTAYFLGKFLCSAPIITPAHILTIALGAGVTGSVGYLYQRYLVAGSSAVDYKRGLGFSGALMGITSVAACLAPTTNIYLYGIIPIPLWATVAGYAFFDGYYLNQENSRVGHAGHLGGLAFGIAYYLLRLRGLRI